MRRIDALAPALADVVLFKWHDKVLRYRVGIIGNAARTVQTNQGVG